MSHEPKLEVYKLKLFNKQTGRYIQFREIFREKLSYTHLPKPIRDEDIYRAYYIDFLKKIDTKAYQQNKTQTKAFTIAKDTIDGTIKTHISNITNDDFVISGQFQGGKYGIKRNVGEVDNTDDNNPLDKKKVIGDRFYFLLYTPISHVEGILMIQGYTESKISDIVRSYLLDYFKVEKKITSKFEFYAPESFKAKYLNGATFKSMKFSSNWIVKPDSDDPIPDEYEIEVKIEVIDKSKNKTNYKNFKEIIHTFGLSLFKPNGGKQKALEDFEKKNAKMFSRGKEMPIDFDDEDNIKPVILLKENGINIDDGHVPDFEQIDVFCRKLLSEIEKEIRPTNAVSEL